MKTSKILLVCSLVAMSVAARADFTYQETTQITGGSLVSMMKVAGTFSRQARQAGEPIRTTVMVKGNRMVRVERDRTEIVDLDAGTITVIDHLKKQYTTMTFEQMRQQMEAAIAKAKAQQAKQEQQPTDNNEPQKVDVKFNVKVRETGASREVAGVEAKESILTMTMDATDQKSGQTGSLAITNDMYLAPEIPGYEEVREFYKCYALKMGTVMKGGIDSQMMATMQQPAAGKGMADMVEEMSKLKGVPVLQIMRGDDCRWHSAAAASEAPLPAAAPTPSAGEVARQAASSAVTGSIPFGGFGKKKEQEAPPPADTAVAQSAAAVLVESNTEMTSFSQASVDASSFNLPAGYTRVEPRPIE